LSHAPIAAADAACFSCSHPLLTVTEFVSHATQVEKVRISKEVTINIYNGVELSSGSRFMPNQELARLRGTKTKAK
jgi:hypothetical protein